MSSHAPTPKDVTKGPWSFPIVRQIRNEVALCRNVLSRNPADSRYVPRWWRSRFFPAEVEAIPWWPYRAIDHVSDLLGKTSTVFEYGCGGSTLWLAGRVGSVKSVEHNPIWFERLGREISGRRMSNVEILLEEPHPVTTHTPSSSQSGKEAGDFSAYIGAVDRSPDHSFDLVTVDGRCRLSCVAASIRKIKPGGFVLLDDADRPEYADKVPVPSSWKRIELKGIKPGKREPTTLALWQSPSSKDQV